MISTAVYRVLSDELHSHTFQPPGGHLQTIKVHKIKITTATWFLNVQIEISVLVCYNIHISIKS